MDLTILSEMFVVCRLDPKAPIPSWVSGSSFSSINRTKNELSVVCEQKLVPQNIKAERDWKIFKIEGPLDFKLTGILSSITNPLADAKVSLFAISTYDTDYFMVKNTDLEKARTTLEKVGFHIKCQ